MVKLLAPEGNSTGPYAVAAYLLSGLAVCCVCCAGVMVRGLHRSGWPMILALPCAWWGAEQLLDGFLRTGVCTTFDLQRLAITQAAGSPLVQLADLGGAPFVSWIVAAVNGAVLDGLIGAAKIARSTGTASGTRIFSLDKVQVPLRSPWMARCMLGLLCILVCYAEWRLLTVTHRAGPVIAVAPQAFDSTLNARLSAVPFAADLVIWPETALAHDWIEADGPPAAVAKLARGLNRPILLGCRRFGLQPLGLFNSALAVSSNGEVIGYADKRFLAPFQEVAPPILAYGSSWIGLEGHCLTQAYQTAAGVPRPLPVGRWIIGVGICHDVCLPEWSADLANSQADLLVLIGNESFDRTGVGRSRMLACARSKAVGQFYVASAVASRA